MSMLNALAMLGSGAKGFVQGGRDEEAAQRARNAEDFAQQQRSFQSNQMQRTLQQQAAVAAAGQPVQATPDMIQGTDGQQVQNTEPDPSTDSIDVGQPGTAPAIPTSTVAGKSGLNPMQTQAALASQNSPDATVQRQAAALSQTDPVAAMKMKSDATQQQAMKMDMANKMFDNDLNTAAGKFSVGGWAPLEKALSDSGATPNAARMVVSSDGKHAEANIVQPDGSLKPTGMVYDNTAQGAMDAAGFLARSTPIQAKLSHALAATTQQQKSRHDMAMEAIGEHHNEVMDNWYKPRGDAALQNAETNRLKLERAGNTLARLSPDDKAEYDDLHKKSAALDASLTKGRMDAAAMGQQFDPQNPTLAPLFEQQAILNRKMQQLVGKYRTAAQDSTGPTTRTTTRPATPMETVLQDMKKTGTTQANVQLAGQPQMQIGAGPASAAMPPAPAGAAPAAPSVQDQIAAAQAPVVSDYKSRLAAQLSVAAKAAQDPDLAKLEQMRMQAIQAGKPMLANNIIAQISKLRQMRYGLN